LVEIRTSRNGPGTDKKIKRKRAEMFEGWNSFKKSVGKFAKDAQKGVSEAATSLGDSVSKVAVDAEKAIFGEDKGDSGGVQWSDTRNNASASASTSTRPASESSGNNPAPKGGGFKTKVGKPMPPLLTYCGPGSRFPNGGGIQSLPNQRAFIDANGDLANAFYEVDSNASLKKNLIFCDRREQKIRIFRVNGEMRGNLVKYDLQSPNF
jgi:hypothetical protein